MCKQNSPRSDSRSSLSRDYLFSFLSKLFLAHWIRTSDIYPRIENLTHVILPRLSREGCTLVVLEHMQHNPPVTSLLC